MILNVTAAAAHDDDDDVQFKGALLCCHDWPVRGPCFSQFERQAIPNLLPVLHTTSRAKGIGSLTAMQINVELWQFSRERL